MPKKPVRNSHFDPPAKKLTELPLPPIVIDWEPLPILFENRDAWDIKKPIASLRQAINVHRMLFLWYAFPSHINLQPRILPLKAELQANILASVARNKSGVCNGAILLKQAIEFLRWLNIVHATIDKNLRDSHIHPPYEKAEWKLHPGGRKYLDQSSSNLMALLGLSYASVTNRLPAFSTQILDRCALLALPEPHSAPPPPNTWMKSAGVLLDYPEHLSELVNDFGPLVAFEEGSTIRARKPQSKRRASENKPPTSAQSAAYAAVSKYRTYTAAGRSLNKHPKTIEQAYKEFIKKLPGLAVKLAKTARTQKISTDFRGQPNVSPEDDKRQRYRG